MRQLRGIRPSVGMIAGYYSFVGPGYYALLTRGLDAAIRSMKQQSGRVVVIGDVPERTRQPVDCLLADAKAGSCTEPLTSNESQLTSNVEDLAQADQVALVDTTSWFCYEMRCPLVIGNYIAYRDENHVSATYATALAGAFRSAFDTAIRLRR
jgi:hypothetical protein